MKQVGSLKEPELPLTNNRAEQAIRPLVILRKISYGSKIDEGSRAITLLASVTTVFVRYNGLDPKRGICFQTCFSKPHCVILDGWISRVRLAIKH